MEPNEPLNAAPQPDAAPVTTQSPAATQERPAEKPRAAVRVTQQFVVRMQRGQNEAALPPKGGKPPLRHHRPEHPVRPVPLHQRFALP